ncbi:MAG: ABC-2 transporter permease [Oscillospiraceae bacterium]|nr:ABC-2 transporter permease [Oscillospiraceae bacterium]
MKDILKIMRFDFLSARPYALAPAAIILLLCAALSLFFSPIISAYITFGAAIFIIPLGGVAEKSGFNRLYGILPVNRKNITRARFIYIFFLHFIAEIIEIAIAFVSFNLKLNKLLPNQNGELAQMVSKGFEDGFLIPVAIIAAFILFCLLFGYMEMMGQLFGRENELKIIIITLGVVCGVVFVILLLAEREIIPTLKFPSLPVTTAGKVILGVVLNIIMLGICVLFGEITANRLAKREL